MEEIAPKIVAGERRLTMLLMGYWQDTRGGRRAPLERTFKKAIPFDILSDCFVFLPAKTGHGGRLHDIGENIARTSGIVTTSLAFSDVPPGTLIHIASKWLDRVLGQGAPVVDEGGFENQKGDRVLYRSTLLPLEDMRGEIVQVLGGARYKVSQESG
jgi:hypothetical protein